MENYLEMKIVTKKLDELCNKVIGMEKKIDRYKDYQFFLENSFLKGELTLEKTNTVLSFLENTNLSINEIKKEL